MAKDADKTRRKRCPNRRESVAISLKALLIQLPIPSVDRDGLSHCFQPENGIKLLEEAT